MALAAGVALALGGGCASSPAGSGGGWPPAPGEAGFPVIVSIDTWHAMIALPPPSGGPPAAADRPGDTRYEEWGYAEHAWYLEGRQGVSGVVRALLWPTRAVVEVARTDRIWAERTPDPPSDVFAFQVSAAGLERLRQHLRATIATGRPVAEGGGSRFYPAVRRYHLLHHCHQYAALALREAGLPVSAAGALTRSGLAGQLRRALETGAEGAWRARTAAAPAGEPSRGP